MGISDNNSSGGMKGVKWWDRAGAGHPLRIIFWTWINLSKC